MSELTVWVTAVVRGRGGFAHRVCSYRVLACRSSPCKRQRWRERGWVRAQGALLPGACV
ncbi:hypothetical protein ATSB10_15760 [Dyella thiooxydans]|uniref:Uncharacterized protein n=1 Tax=Dyella thiooxydans TaxID=445710 RepID=A0A160N080_9GAMM|nr:hypothetical protein ATSB10_15760 [Dyella thiooxydans]